MNNEPRIILDSGDIKQEILVLTSSQIDQDVTRGGSLRTKLPNVTSVEITHLQTQINVFLTQLDTIMAEAPEKVGAFKLTEFEVTAGIVVQGKGQIGIALLGLAELSGQVNAGLKFVFKRS